MSAKRPVTVAALLATAALAIAGCGGSAKAPATPIDVDATSSLQKPLEAYAATLKTVKPTYAFNGSGSIALEIEQGLSPDVFVSANPTLPDYLYEKGLVEKPVVFAQNPVVLAVPKASPVVSLEAVEARGIRIGISKINVPLGVATKEALQKLPVAQRHAIVSNIVTSQALESALVERLSSGAIDAAFLYATAVRSDAAVLRAVELPARARVATSYNAAVVKSSKHQAQGRAFIEGLLSGPGRSILTREGLQPPASG